MEYTAEERAEIERQIARCRNDRIRLLALRGDSAARKELDENWSPLLRRPPLPDVPCRLPYDAPELLP